MSDTEPSLIKHEDENKQQRGLCTQFTKHTYIYIKKKKNYK